MELHSIWHIFYIYAHRENIPKTLQLGAACSRHNFIRHTQRRHTMNRPTSTQPGVDSTLKIYGAKKLPTVKVKLKDGDKELIINQSDFDPDRHVRLD